MYRCKSHPEKLLIDHLENVYQIGKTLFSASPFSREKEMPMVTGVCLLFHDFAKASTLFQEYLDAHIKFDTGKISEEVYHEILYNIKKKSRHSILSALFCYYLLTEKLSIGPKAAFLALNAVSKHHGHLDDFSNIHIGPSDLEDYRQIAGTVAINEINYLLKKYFKVSCTLGEFDLFLLKFKCRKLKKEVKKTLIFNDYFRMNYLFSLLVYSDKKECILGKDDSNEKKLHVPVELVEDYKVNLPSSGNEIFKIRNEAYEEVKNRISDLTGGDRILCLNLPTGAGKTLTVMNAALMIRSRFPDLTKIVYCLPFTSIIDQVGALIRQELLNTDSTEMVMTHHHLVDFFYKTDDHEYDTNESEFLITSWESEIIITTFYQLLHSILSNRNENVRKICSLQNSVIILDEIQAIPFQYWKLVHDVFLSISELYNIRFILTTATMPLIFKPEEVFELALNKASYYERLNRIYLDISLLKQKMDLDMFITHLLTEMKEHPDKSFLIILNTIRSSLVVYDGIKEYNENIIYLSSNIVPEHRLNRIHSIKKSTNPQIVISTQLVEAGVDIDFDIVYRDFAPLDSIFQACGRCNRNNFRGKGVVKILNLIDRNKTPFWKYIYDNVNCCATKDILLKGQQSLIEEKIFYTLALSYYHRINETKSNSTSNDILDLLCQLEYKAAFTGKDAFQLIKNDIPKIKVYVCVDEPAEELWLEYIRLKKENFKDIYTKNSMLKNHRKKMARYVISIADKSLSDNPGYYLIEKDSLLTEYNIDTGYILRAHGPSSFSL